MANHQNPQSAQNQHPHPTNSRVSGETGHNGRTAGYSNGQKYPNPPDATNPDSAALKEQWKFAIRQSKKWSAHAWGTAMVAGLSLFALGWIIKGSNPLPSFKHADSEPKSKTPSSSDAANAYGS